MAYCTCQNFRKFKKANCASLMKTVSEEEQFQKKRATPSQTSKNKFEPERPFVQCMQYVSHW